MKAPTQNRILKELVKSAMQEKKELLVIMAYCTKNLNKINNLLTIFKKQQMKKQEVAPKVAPAKVTVAAKKVVPTKSTKKTVLPSAPAKKVAKAVKVAPKMAKRLTGK